MLFDNVNWNFNNGPFTEIPGSNFNEDNQSGPKFLSPEEGFLRGNLFEGEYEPYKNMTFYKLKPENERERLLFQLMAMCFAINDLNLYLDLNPDDKMAFELFKKYSKEKNRLEQQYTENYGPVTITETQGTNFNWIDNPWPWDKMGGSNYV